MSESVVKQSAVGIVNNPKNKKILSWFWVAAAVVYFISPLDAVPDIIPVGGWLDDYLIISVVLVNFIQQNFFQQNQTLNNVLEFTKKTLITCMILVSAVFVLLLFMFVKI